MSATIIDTLPCFPAKVNDLSKKSFLRFDD